MQEKNMGHICPIGRSRDIHVHIAYNLCAKDQIKNRTPKVPISRFKFILYD